MTNPAYGKCYPFDSGSGQQAGSAEWRVLASAWGDGIVGDNRNTVAFGGDGASSFQLSVNASDRVITLTKLGPYRLRGIMFEPTEDSLALGALPAPAAGQQQSHMVVARMDPTAKNITFVIKSGVATTGTPGRPGLTRTNDGVWEDPLWRLDGGNGAGTTLTRREYRRWCAPTFALWDADALDTLIESAPLGSRAQIIGGDEYLLRSLSGDISWVNLTNPDWSALSLLSGVVASTIQPETRVARGHREFRGDVKKSSGSWGPGIYAIGSVSDDPGTQRGTTCLPVSVGSGTATVNGWVAADGTVRIRVPAGGSVTSFFLDPLIYALES